MISMSNEEKMLYQNSTKNIVLEFGDGTILDNNDIYYESFSLEQMICNDNELRFGKCIPAELNIKIFKIPKSHIGDSVNVKITVGEYTRDFGTYYVIEDRLSDDKMFREIKAYDKLYIANNTDVAEWYNGLQFPIRMKDFRDSLFSYLGIEQKETTLPNDSMVIEQTVKQNALSGKDVIESICEVNACFGQIDYDGKFKYVILETGGSALYPSDTLYPSDYLFPKDVVNERMTESSFKLGTLKYEDFLVKKITQIQVRMEEGDIGVTYGIDGNTYVIEDNFLLYGKNQQQLSEMAMNFFTKLHFVEYSPLSVETQGEPWLELGDFVKVVNGRDSLYFPILHRTLKGIQSLSDTFEAQGVERYTEKVNGIQNEIIKLKGKSNTLTRNIEETRSEITNLDSYVKDNYLTTLETQSAIIQSANAINLRVDSVQRQVNGQVNTWYGTVAPTLSNYPANQWTTDELKDNHNGDKYFIRDSSGNILKGYRFLLTNDAYGWQEMSDTDVTQALNEALKAQQQVEELRSDVDITAKQIQATVGQSTTKYVTSYDISYNGFGNPDTNAYLNGTNPLNKYYMNQLNGEIWRCTSYSNGVATWSKVGTAQTTASYTQSQITAAANQIESRVAQSVTEWDTSDYAISYRGYGQPSISASGKSGKYYLNQQNGFVYLSNGSAWNKVTELKSKTDELSTQITQTANQISSKVSKGSIISEINQSAESVSINASKINLNGAVTANNNFKINTDGTVVAVNGQFSGNINGSSIVGGNINIGNGRFSVNSNGNITTSGYQPQDSTGIGVWVVGNNGQWAIPRSMNFINGLFVGWGSLSGIPTKNLGGLPNV